MPAPARFACPACGSLTWIGYRPDEATHDICPVCSWADSGIEMNSGFAPQEWGRRFALAASGPELFGRPAPNFHGRPPRPEEVPADGGPLLVSAVERAQGWAETARWALDARGDDRAELRALLKVLEGARAPSEEVVEGLLEALAGHPGDPPALGPLEVSLERVRHCRRGVPAAQPDPPLALVVPALGEPRPARDLLPDAGDLLAGAIIDAHDALDETLPGEAQWGTEPANVLTELGVVPSYGTSDDFETARERLPGLARRLEGAIGQMGDPRAVDALRTVRARIVPVERLLAGDVEPIG